jgi:RNA recognition motif-containing protein
MKNLYVGNLPHSTTEGDLRSAFAVYGAVDSVSIITDRDTGQARGFGFVEMTDADAAEKAIAGLNGSDLGGRTIQVNEAKPKADKPRGNGGQRFGGGGRRNGGRGAREQRW